MKRLFSALAATIVASGIVTVGPKVHQRPVERPLKHAGHLAGRQKRVIPSCLPRAVVGDFSAGPGIVGRSRAEIERAACVKRVGGRC
jgi:hypothetical protein